MRQSRSLAVYQKCCTKHASALLLLLLWCFLLQDVLMIFQRCLDVLFYDIQMVASVVHSNRMLEGMTQVRTQLCCSCC